MKRLLIKSLLVGLLLFSAVPVFAADANYDSNGVTAFYGKYEYPKEDPNKKDPSKNEESTLVPSEETAAGTGSIATPNYSSALPSYKGEGTIIPVMGDTSNLLTSIIGLALLVLVFLKLKEVENAEKQSTI